MICAIIRGCRCEVNQLDREKWLVILSNERVGDFLPGVGRENDEFIREGVS